MEKIESLNSELPEFFLENLENRLETDPLSIGGLSQSFSDFCFIDRDRDGAGFCFINSTGESRASCVYNACSVVSENNSEPEPYTESENDVDTTTVDNQNLFKI